MRREFWLAVVFIGICYSAAEPRPRQYERTKRQFYYGDPNPSFPFDYQVNVNLEEVQFRVSDQFLSVTLDASYLGANWSAVDQFKVPRLLTLSRALAPAMLRVGGAGADYLLFNRLGRIMLA